MSNDNVSRFAALFRGNNRSFGQFDPRQPDANRSSHTKKGAYSDVEIMRHLTGATGLGIVPINDDSTCHWGAIDIDNHNDKSVDLDIAAIESRVEALRLPLITCRSKSGGVHLFLFGREPLRAATVHSILKKWAKDLNVVGVDCIFPKQSKLAYSDSGDRALGNWINLPYFGGDGTRRYAVENGQPLSLELFLSLAESRAISSYDLDKIAGNEHTEAPPCIQAGMADGIDSGSRNEFAYNLTIYMKKRFPEDFKDRIFDLNSQIFAEPLPFIEIRKVVNSGSRRDYRYKCSTEPCKSLCDRKACLTRQFGITQDQADEADAELQLPAFNGLVQYTTNPVRWELSVDDTVKLMLSTEELFEWRVLRHKIAERLLRVVPFIKNDKWQKILTTLMANCRKEIAPEDASSDGIIKSQLVEFVRKVDLMNDGLDIGQRQNLFRGIPVVQTIDGTKFVFFRAQDFVTFLKRNKSEEMKGVNLWFSLREHGVQHGRLRVGDKSPSVWSIEVSAEHHLVLKAPNFEPEI